MVENQADNLVDQKCLFGSGSVPLRRIAAKPFGNFGAAFCQCRLQLLDNLSAPLAYTALDRDIFNDFGDNLAIDDIALLENGFR